MVVCVYLEGCLSPDQHHVSLPLSSCAVLLAVTYSHPSAFRLQFVRRDHAESDAYVNIPAAGLSSLQHQFVSQSSLPQLIGNVVLPAVQDVAARMVRSGLCVVVRHIIKVAHAALPEQGLTQLLGFRQGSLRMCAEVSGWTKLCEVELPHSLSLLVHHLHSLSAHTDQDPQKIELPTDLLKLEAHFHKPPKVHNDDRRRRTELAILKTTISHPEKWDEVLKNCRLDGSHFVLERETPLPHGWKKFRVHKEVAGVGEVTKVKDVSRVNGTAEVKDVNGVKEVKVASGVAEVKSLIEAVEQCTVSEKSEGMSESEQVCQIINTLTYLDIEFVHLYSEGVEMTIADLCLFSYFYFLLESLQFKVSGLSEHIPRVVNWLRHMVTLPRLLQACAQFGLNVADLKKGLLNDSTVGGESNSLCDDKVGGGESNSLQFVKATMEDVTEDDMELSRRCRTKYKAIKPEVLQALANMKDRGIEPQPGHHPRGSEVGLEWDTFPAFVHPKEGEVPVKRVERKCQQLENLVTAVMEVARPGDIIVDFCSGGGHLGIAIAYLLPQCTVYLVENKEESLAKAQTRMAAMNSDNIILYQCNLDYFVGKFDVGVCLHACGSATDMVLHQCLSNQAAFVICPCCYGSIQKTHLLTYPRSRLYQDKYVTYMEFLTLGHAADQTEFNIALEQQGRQCMNLVDSDRAELAREAGYNVTLTSLQPLTCSPKNNLLIGQKCADSAVVL